MKPKRIILVRHGESEGNVDREVYAIKPDYALLLTEKGENQAKEAGKNLSSIGINGPNTMFYVSPLFRTRQTFENIASELTGKISYKEDPRLREQEWGHLKSLDSCSNIDSERDAYGTFYFRIPDGESAADVYDRVASFCSTLFRDFEKEDFPENVVIVTHGMAIRLFLMKWFHYSVEEFESLKNPSNCQIVILERDENMLKSKKKYVLKTEMKKHEVTHKWQRPIVLN